MVHLQELKSSCLIYDYMLLMVIRTTLKYYCFEEKTLVICTKIKIIWRLRFEKGMNGPSPWT